MKNTIIFLQIAIFLIIGINSVSAYTIIVRPLNASGDEQPLTSFAYIFNFTSNSDCSGVILSSSSNVTTDNNGVAVIELDTSLINQIPSYICEYRNSSLRKVHNVSDQFFNNVYAHLGNFSNVTSDYYFGSARYMTDLDAIFNKTYADTLYGNISWIESTFIPYTGATDNVDLNSRVLTGVGQLIMEGLISTQDMIPLTDDLYSLGNSTHWFKELFVKDIYAETINATEITTTNLTSEKVNTTSATIGGFEVYKDEGGDFNIDLG